MSRTPVRKYQSAMAKKQFLTTHQGIAFDTNTRLIDGQHRLEANAGLPAGGEVTLLVTWNLPPRQTAFGKLKIDTQDNMDNTKGRSIRSTLSDQGWIRAKAFASTLNALSQSAGQCTNPGLSIDMALAILDIFRPEFKELDQAVMPLVCDRAGINAALILLLRLHPEATRNFIKALQAAPNRSLQRSDLGYTAPELLVHRYANNHRVDRCWSWSAVQMRNTLKAFTVFLSAPTARWQYLRDTNAFETTYLEQLPNEVTSIRTAIGKKVVLKTQAELELLAQTLNGKACNDRQTGIRIAWKTVTPEQTQTWLDTVPANKQLERRNTRKIRRMAEVMKSGGWLITHQGLALDENGILLDGRERLTACVCSATAFFTMVAEGVSRKHEKYIDTGR